MKEHKKLFQKHFKSDLAFCLAQLSRKQTVVCIPTNCYDEMSQHGNHDISLEQPFS